MAKELECGPRTKSEAAKGDEYALNNGLEGLGALFNSFGIALLSLLNREPEQPAKSRCFQAALQSDKCASPWPTQTLVNARVLAVINNSILQ